MRTRLVIGLAGGAFFLLAGTAGFLVAFRGEPRSAARSASTIEAADPLEADAEFRPSGQRPPSRIVPMHVEEIVDEPILPNPAAAAHVVLAGDVLDWNGAPAATIDVSAFRVKDGAPAGAACVRVDTDARGRFQLSIPGTAPMEIILAAFKAGRRPATLPLTFAATESRKDARLSFDLGAAIEGTITLDGRPVRGARVSADSKSAPTGFPFVWNGASFETKRAAAYCDDEGRFVITGLAPEAYWIETDQLVSENSIGLAGRAEVVAPASGVRLGVHSGRVLIRVLANGEDLPEAKVAVLDPAGRRRSVPEPWDFRVASGITLKVEAVERGFAAKQIAVPALTAGETRHLDVVLEPDGSPELRLALRGASGMNLAKVSVQLIPMSAPGHEGVCVQKEVRRGLHAERTYRDQFSMKNVPYPAGPYILVLLPEPPESWFTPLQTEIVLPSSGFAEVALDLVPGGRLGVRFAASNERNAFLSGAYVLRDATGTEVDSSPAGRAAESGPQDGRAEAASLRRSTRVIPAGTYEIEARSEGFRTVREAVTVVGGSDNPKVITLEREKN